MARHPRHHMSSQDQQLPEEPSGPPSTPAEDAPPPAGEPPTPDRPFPGEAPPHGPARNPPPQDRGVVSTRTGVPPRAA
jgi:hypothetical protein